jgi:hypothetical protein
LISFLQRNKPAFGFGNGMRQYVLRKTVSGIYKKEDIQVKTKLFLISTSINP